MKITLRKRKLKKGRTKLYLDIYKGYTKSEDGKILSIRDYEELDLYLYEKASYCLVEKWNDCQDERCGMFCKFPSSVPSQYGS